MTAAEARKHAERGLEFMREHAGEHARCFGFVWATLAQIAGKGDLPLPDIRAALAKANGDQR